MWARRLLLLLVLSVTPSCAYLTDRGVDFLDQWRGVVGVGTGGGIRLDYFGLVESGLLFGVKPQRSAFGWKYGRAFLFNNTTNGPGLEADQSWVFVTSAFEDWDYSSGDYKLARKSFFLLPAALSWVDTTRRKEPRWYVPEEGVELIGDNYIWSAATWNYNRFAMIHAFDVEFEIAILAYLDLGYSVGETFDFFLGILTIDLAKDDGRLYAGDKK